MARLLTEVNCKPLAVQCGLNDRILLLGSCFADEIGSKLQAAGFDVCVNPFGTLYNPASIAMAVKRLCGNDMFTSGDCVQMGAGSARICSFEHHTSFAREDAQEFLRNANEALEQARSAWKSATKVIVTLGTARVWEHLGFGNAAADAESTDGQGRIVSNCLKRDGREFRSRMLSVEETTDCLRSILKAGEGKEFIFTISPIRHLGEGAHDNTLSKATLHLALAGMMSNCAQETSCAAGSEQASAPAAYFPAYEILCDELRDYRFYARDLVHPSDLAVDIIWERFLDCATPAAQRKEIEASLKQHKQSQHRPLQ